MTERPILFNSEMVRAILDGRKTQSRRIVKNPKYSQGLITKVYFEECGNLWYVGNDGGGALIKCPYGKIGDRLYVKETWFVDDPAKAQDVMSLREGIFYKATEENPSMFKWKPSIHMPRWASRITLEITNIRVERLRDISNEDIVKEGLGDWSMLGVGAHHRNSFIKLWQSIYGPGSWNLNPWVWVLEFKKF